MVISTGPSQQDLSTKQQVVLTGLSVFPFFFFSIEKDRMVGRELGEDRYLKEVGGKTWDSGEPR